MIFNTAVTTRFDSAVLGLTPLQRLDAVRQYHSSPASTQLFMTVIGILVCTLLVLVLIWNRQRKKADRQSSHFQFGKEAQAKKLTDREYRLLLDIATNLCLKRSDSIFRLPTAFNRGAAELISIVADSKGAGQSMHLEAELALLRDKLGFKPMADSSVNGQKQTLSSCDIPLKKKLYLRRLNRPGCDLEAAVINNTPSELTVEFDHPVEIVLDQPWLCRYCLRGLVAEFYTTVIRCSGCVVTLKHSHHVRLINRRRFPRVRMSHPAFIARFPFKYDSLEEFTTPRKLMKIPDVSKIPDLFSPPAFVPATLTEMGGPGIKISTDLDIHMGERVLLMLRLDPPQSTQPSYRTMPNWRMIQDIAKVRSVAHKDGRVSAALEFINLDDRQIGEMIRMTNEIMIHKANPHYRHIHSTVERTDSENRVTV